MGFSEIAGGVKHAAKRHEWKKKNKVWQKKLNRTLQYAECAAALDQCAREFDTSILLEQRNYQERREQSLPTKRQEERIREAARGRRIVDEAKAELEDSTMSGDQTEALNMLCLALKQLNRIKGKRPSIDFSFEKKVKSLFRDQSEYEMELEEMELPEDVDQYLTPAFINGLLAGNSYNECMRGTLDSRKNPKSAIAEEMGRRLDSLPDSAAIGKSMSEEDIHSVKKIGQF